MRTYLPVVYSLVLLLACLWLPTTFTTTGQAQTPPTAAPATSAGATTEAPKKESITFFGLIWESSYVGAVIMLLSVAAVTLSIEHVRNIRAPVLMPPGLAEQIYEMLQGGHFAQAEQQCRMQPSFLSYVLHAGISEIEGGWPVVEKAMEDTAAEQAARLYRKIEYLSLIGNIAPMLGLLGTVMGMVGAFKSVAETQGVPNVADLAGGIYLALVTTVEGLLVAIPSLAAFAFFRNRVDQLVAEATYVAQHVFAPLRRNRLQRTRPSTGQVPPQAPPATGRSS